MSHGHDWCSKCGTSHGYICGIWQCPLELKPKVDTTDCRNRKGCTKGGICYSHAEDCIGCAWFRAMKKAEEERHG